MQPSIKITAIVLDLLEVLAGADEGLDALTLSQRSKRSASRAYVALASLEYTGWVQSDWSEDLRQDNDRRRLYRLTGAGRVAVGELTFRHAGRGRRSLAVPRPVVVILRLIPAHVGGVR